MSARLTEVNLGTNDTAVPAVRKLDGAVNGTEMQAINVDIRVGGGSAGCTG
jgi:hypothetical protein